LYSIPELHSAVRQKIMAKNLKLEHSAGLYLDIYNEIIPAKPDAKS
jgi:hypothetical protein